MQQFMSNSLPTHIIVVTQQMIKIEFTEEEKRSTLIIVVTQYV